VSLQIEKYALSRASLVSAAHKQAGVGDPLVLLLQNQKWLEAKQLPQFKNNAQQSLSSFFFQKNQQKQGQKSPSPARTPHTKKESTGRRAYQSGAGVGDWRWRLAWRIFFNVRWGWGCRWCPAPAPRPVTGGGATHKNLKLKAQSSL
jgi:hypothetical protein